MEYSQMLVNRIKTLCRQRGGITIHRLAKMSSLRQSTLDNIMRGNTKDPRISTLHHIALGFNMTLTEFLDFPELNDYAFEEEDEERKKSRLPGIKKRKILRQTQFFRELIY
ncbi:helix-turn-helix domain-containing protein [Holdemania massiliensis]|uniref:helix-turn-helix domain-containing protein n=1 Tax=Holdemania massiliensis TaxID=1468449 RepID=UPI0035217702